MRNCRSATTFLLSELLVLPATCLAGGGPNPFEGSSLATLWFAPGLASVFVIFVMLATRGAKLALISGAVLALVLLGIVLAGGVGVLIALIAGPWIAFVWLAITLGLHFILKWRSGSESKLPKLGKTKVLSRDA
jgi:hypothetical protein